MKIAVLGSSGEMGSYFAKYFLNAGHTLTGADLTEGRNLPEGLRFTKSNVSAVRNADVVLIAVPIHKTIAVVREVLDSLRHGCVLIEITSVKSQILPILRRMVAGKRLRLVSLHPLFGPSLRSAQMKICLVGSQKDRGIMLKLFPEASLIPLSLESHDRVMAYALSLVHLVNIAFVSVINRDIGLRKFEKVATPTATLQLDIAKSILSQNAGLYSYLDVENDFVSEAFSSLVGELGKFRRILRQGRRREFERLFLALGRTIGENDMSRALQRVYTATGS